MLFTDYRPAGARERHPAHPSILPIPSHPAHLYPAARTCERAACRTRWQRPRWRASLAAPAACRWAAVRARPDALSFVGLMKLAGRAVWLVLA